MRIEMGCQRRRFLINNTAGLIGLMRRQVNAVRRTRDVFFTKAAAAETADALTKGGTLSFRFAFAAFYTFGHEIFMIEGFGSKGNISAGKVEGGRGFIKKGNPVEFFHGATASGDHQSCRDLLEILSDFRIDLHPAEIPCSDQKHLRRLGSHGFDIRELKPMAFTSPPAGPNMIGEDDKIGGVDFSVIYQVTESIPLNHDFSSREKYRWSEL